MCYIYRILSLTASNGVTQSQEDGGTIQQRQSYLRKREASCEAGPFCSRVTSLTPEASSSSLREMRV